MIFDDERFLWASEQEDLAEALAGKSIDEIDDYLNGYKFVAVRKSCKSTRAQRLVQLLTVPLIPVLFILMGVKWVLTGDKYLDSWLQAVGMTSERTDKYFL